jgi:protein phosphatase
VDKVPYWDIHLIHTQSGQETVVHLQTPIELSEAPEQPDSDRISFHFVPGDDPTGLLLERLAGGGLLLVDGKVVLNNAPVHSGSVITVGTLQYRCDLVSRGYLPPKPVIQANWTSITGSVRDHNEDAIGIYQHQDAHCFVLADGVGGAEAGEFVSEFAIKSFLAMFHRHVGNPDTNWHAVMEETVKQINSDVRQFAVEMSQKLGKPVQAGSTLVGVVIVGWDAYLIHVGDSRFYYWRAGVLRQTTADHSTFMESIYARILAGDQTAPLKRNVLVKGIGKDDTIEPDLITLRLQPGDKILMCSDGMSDKVEQDEIAEIIVRRNSREIPSYLAQLGDQRGSGDNISVIFADVLTEAAPSGWQPPAQERAFIGYDSRWRVALDSRSAAGGAKSKTRNLLIAVAAIILIAIIGFVVLQNQGGTAPAVAQETIQATTAVPAVPAEPTDTATRTPTRTRTPSRTPTPTQTFTPTNTPIPPTSTLVPEDTPS